MAHAAEAPDLYAQAREEDRWVEAALAVPGLNGDIRVFVTADGSVKLDQIGDNVTADARITSTQFKRYRDLNEYGAACGQISKFMNSLRSLRNPYELRMRVFPARAENVDYEVRVPGVGAGLRVTALDTAFLPLDTFAVDVEFDAGAVVAHVADYNPARVREALLNQLRKQIPQLTETGEVIFNLAGYDDLACDLVSGRARIKVQLHTHYAQAKLTRTTRLTALDAGRLYDELRGGYRVETSIVRSHILNSRNLERAVNKLLKLGPPLSDDEFVRLEGEFFAVADGALQSINSSDLAPLARRMDQLRAGYTYSLPVYTSRTLSPFAVSTDK